MRLLYIDIDTLRPDHLGCYGYPRNTSPNIDRLAESAVRYDKCYVSDAPCLPSRACMFTGKFGIRGGIVNHGGLAADPRRHGRDRHFRMDGGEHRGFIASLRKAGYYPVTFSPFAERHSAWWWYEGWREMTNTGQGGGEDAVEIVPKVIDWIDAHGKEDNWVLHFNIWDPHTPYRAPEGFGNPFADEPLEGWYTEELRKRQWDSFGPGSPQEPGGAYGNPVNHTFPRQPDAIDSMDAYKRWIDGYDCGIAYADRWVGKVLAALEAQGVMDETIIMVTSDHGENMGELNVIGDHALADHITSRVPMILRVPGAGGARVDGGLYNQVDIAATLIELMGGQVPSEWDGRSFADDLRAGRDGGRDYVVFSQNAWSCQRSVRWDDWVYIRTYHTGLKDLPARMLFNVADDPHELNDLAEARPELADRGQRLLDEWWHEAMRRNPSGVDPMGVVLREGGPYHTRDALNDYTRRLRETGRAEHAAFLEAHPDGLP